MGFSDQPPVPDSSRFQVAPPISRLDTAVKWALVAGGVWAGLNILYTLKILR